MSAELQKSNAMLIRISYFQIVGTISIIVFPVTIIAFMYWFDSNPSNLVNVSLAFVNFFGLYDVVITLVPIACMP